MFTKDEIRNIVIVRARELYGQIEFANMAKGNMDQLATIAEELWDRLNKEIDLTVADLEHDLIPIEEDDEDND